MACSGRNATCRLAGTVMAARRLIVVSLMIRSEAGDTPRTTPEAEAVLASEPLRPTFRISLEQPLVNRTCFCNFFFTHPLHPWLSPIARRPDASTSTDWSPTIANAGTNRRRGQQRLRVTADWALLLLRKADRFSHMEPRVLTIDNRVLGMRGRSENPDATVVQYLN